MATTYYGAPVPVLDQVGEGTGGYVASVATAFQTFDTEIHTARVVTDPLSAITNGVLVMSGGTVSGKRYLIQSYTPTAAQTTTTTYTTLNGSSASFTPNSASSSILYELSFHVQGPRTGALGTVFHIKLYLDSTYQSPHASTFYGTVTHEGIYNFSATIPSWSGAKTLSAKVRSFDASNYWAKLNSSYYLDGAAAEWYPATTLKIYEL